MIFIFFLTEAFNLLFDITNEYVKTTYSKRSTVMASFHLHYEMLTKFQPSLSYFIILPQILTTYALSAFCIYSILLCSVQLLYLTKNKIGNLSCLTWLWGLFCLSSFLSHPPKIHLLSFLSWGFSNNIYTSKVYIALSWQLMIP